MAGIDYTKVTLEEAAQPSDTARGLRSQETARALAQLPPEKLHQLEETEHLIVSIMISREIQSSVKSLVTDRASELSNLLKALAGFRYEVSREMDQASVEIYPVQKPPPALSTR